MSTYTVHGKCRWPRLKEVDKFGKYSVQVLLSDADYKSFMSQGFKNSGKPAEAPDQGWWVTVRADPKAKFFKTINVVDEQGQPVTELIGNGSVITAKLEVYEYNNDFGKGKGTRLTDVCVHSLVKYEKPEGDNTVSSAAAPASVPASSKPRIPF